MKRGLAVLLPFLPLALAWQPALDLELARQVVDGAYSRIPPVPTAVELSPLEVRVLRGEGCLPFPESRPVWARVAGQAEVVEILAERARNEFRRVQAEEVLPEAKRLLPDGHLRVYLRIAGLKRLEHRAAYTLGVRLKTPEGESYIRAYRATYLDDWQEKEDGHTGTLVFYLDLSGKPVDPKGPLEVVFLTESEKDCLYAFTVDLGAFY